MTPIKPNIVRVTSSRAITDSGSDRHRLERASLLHGPSAFGDRAGRIRPERTRRSNTSERGARRFKNVWTRSRLRKLPQCHLPHGSAEPRVRRFVVANHQRRARRSANRPLEREYREESGGRRAGSATGCGRADQECMARKWDGTIPCPCGSGKKYKKCHGSTIA